MPIGRTGGMFSPPPGIPSPADAGMPSPRPLSPLVQERPRPGVYRPLWRNATVDRNSSSLAFRMGPSSRAFSPEAMSSKFAAQ